MRRVLAVLLLAPIAFAADKPKPTTAQAIELAKRWLDAQRSYDGIPGVSVAVVKDQKELWLDGSGVADPAANRAADPDTLYSICSVSKLFTSLAVMQLRDQGKLSLEDPLSKHLSWFHMKPAAEGREATIEGVLTHSAGLPRETDIPYWSGTFDFPTHEQIVERVASQEALYPSERYFQYSNLGLTLAGEVVSAVSGQPYADYVKQHLLAPIGLTSTYPEIPLHEKGKRLAVGYSAKRRDGTRAALAPFQARGVAPAAGYASTARDLAHFAEWQFRVLANKDDKVIDPRTLREMYRPHFVDPDFNTFWGLGFAVRKSGDDVFVGHGGSCPGFRTDVRLKADDKVGVIALANASGVDAGGYTMAIYKIIAPAIDSDTKPKTDLSAYTGSYSQFPWGGETIVVPWGDELISIDVPTMDPMKNPERLRKVGDNQFRRVRDDGALGETVTFEIGPDGRATKFWQFSNPSPRMNP
jgi:CubicO group peptidase (beta-lactamase class C family)